MKIYINDKAIKIPEGCVWKAEVEREGERSFLKLSINNPHGWAHQKEDVSAIPLCHLIPLLLVYFAGDWEYGVLFIDSDFESTWEYWSDKLSIPREKVDAIAIIPPTVSD